MERQKSSNRFLNVNKILLLIWGIAVGCLTLFAIYLSYLRIDIPQETKQQKIIMIKQIEAPERSAGTSEKYEKKNGITASEYSNFEDIIGLLVDEIKDNE